MNNNYNQSRILIDKSVNFKYIALKEGVLNSLYLPHQRKREYNLYN